MNFLRQFDRCQPVLSTYDHRGRNGDGLQDGAQIPARGYGAVLSGVNLAPYPHAHFRQLSADII